MAIKYTTPEVAKNTTSRDIEALAAQECKLQEKSVEYTQNAEFVVTPDEGYDGMSKVNVSVDVVVPTVQATKEITITQNGPIEILPDSDYDVMEKVSAQINVPVPTPTLQEKHITIDKNLSMTEVKPDAGYQGLSSIEVDVEIPVEGHREVTITENGTTMIHPADGYDYMEFIDVTVNVPTGGSIDVAANKIKLQGSEFTEVPECLDFTNVTNGEGILQSCPQLTSFTKELPNLQNGAGMFNGDTALTSFNIDMPELTSGDNMFGVTGLTSFTASTPKMTNGNYMFASCNKLKSITLNAILVEARGMFSNCGLLENPILDTSRLVNAEEMFSQCLRIGSTDWGYELPVLSNGKTMFWNTSIGNWNIELPALIEADCMFQNTTLSSWNIDLSSVQSAGGMFEGCSSLTTVTTNFSGLIVGGAIFSNCPNLTTITLTGTLDTDYLDFSIGLEALTIDSLVSILDALKDRTEDTRYTLVLGESHLSKLADEQKAIATNKNWILA